MSDEISPVIENQEEGGQGLRPDRTVENQVDRVVLCTRSTILQFLCGLLIYMGFAVSCVFYRYYVQKTGSFDDDIIVASTIFVMYFLLLFWILFCTNKCSWVMSLWNCVFKRAPRNANPQAVGDRDNQNTSSPLNEGSRLIPGHYYYQEPLESSESLYPTSSPEDDSEREASLQITGPTSSDSCSYATPAEECVVIHTSAEVCSFKTISEAASKMSRIVSPLEPKVIVHAGSSRASSSAEDLIKVSSRAGLVYMSESEGVSSGELRRKKLRCNPDELPVATDLTSSASCSYGTPAESAAVLRPSSEACTVKIISEVASKISQIASALAPAMRGSGEAGQAAEGVQVSSQSSRGYVSGSEGMSSSELRRRKLLQLYQLPESSSDEEPKKD